jgi:CBS domain-containing protein
MATPRKGTTMKIAEVLASKGHTVATVHPQISVDTAARLLRSRRIGALVVSGHGHALDGILSERDIVYALAVDRSVLDREVGEVMTTRVVTARPEDSVAEAMAMMTRERCRHLPVLRDGQLEGIVSIGDLVKARLQELELETRVLRDVVIASH